MEFVQYVIWASGFLKIPGGSNVQLGLRGSALFRPASCIPKNPELHLVAGRLKRWPTTRGASSDTAATSAEKTADHTE